MSQPVEAYIDANRKRFLQELFTFLRIPSISTLPDHQPDVAKAAGFVAESLKSAGMENVEIIPTDRHPLVYADWMHAPGKPTVLCYGHYDVQPPDPLDEWVTPPFEPTIRNGNIYARGAVDDKGQMYMHIKAVESLLNVNGSLPGEREVPDRGRRGGRRGVHREVRQGKPRQAEGRCSASLRYRAICRRYADTVYRSARLDLHGGGSQGPCKGPSFGPVRRRCAECGLWPDRVAVES